MGRRQRNSLMEDLVNIVAKLPWWVGLTSAVIFYLILSRYVATPTPDVDPSLGTSATFIRQSFFKTLAGYGQYLLPVLCVSGAIFSLIERLKRKHLFNSATTSDPGSVLRKMSWQEFEMLVGEYFRRCGYVVEKTGGGGADGGIDLTLFKGSEIFFVQCKQWNAYKVSVNVVRELYGVMAAQGAAGGYLVTSGVFTSDAITFTRGKNIELIDGSILAAQLRERHLHSGSVNIRQFDKSEESYKPDIMTLSRSCPQCGGLLVRRTARRGPNAGRDFWGCSEFPKCRGVVND